MAKRATLSTVPSYLPGATSASAINANDDALNAAFDNTLSRDGSTPNQMLADFDMNSNDILNVKNINAVDIIVGGTSIIAQVTAAAASATNATTSETNAATSEINAATSETNAAASAAEAADKVSKSGDTMTGLLVLSGDATAALNPASKQQVDAADALKAPLASPALTGDPTAPTPLTADNDTSIATTAYVQAQTYETVANVALKAPLVSPALTGTPTAPTASPGTNTTQLASTAFVEEATSGAIKIPITDSGGFYIGTEVEAALQEAAVLTQGKESIWIPISEIYARTSNGPASGTFETTTNKVVSKTFDFDASAQEFVQFVVRMPKRWNLLDVEIFTVWSHPATTVNFGVVFQHFATAFADDDALDGTAFVVEGQSIDIGGVTDNLYLTPTSEGITVQGAPAADEFVVFQVKRFTGSGSDTMAVDARVHGFLLVIVTNANTDD